MVDDRYAEPYRDKGVPETMARFYGMITNIDENLGRLRKTLADRGLAENTIVVFMTDNGTAAGRAPRRNESGTWKGFNAGMRGQKGSEFEGGHRVPCFWHWPAGGVGGGRDVSALAAHIDVFPTLVELCGLPAPGGRPRDGASFAAALRGADAAGPDDRTLFVHSQRIEHPRKWRKSAVMTQRWRLINGEELYDLTADPGQRTNVAEANREVVAGLRASYDAWWKSLEPVLSDYVRIGIGGPEDPVWLMSHDWHANDKGVPWHQNHVRNGYVSNGPWAIDVRQPGEYEITLYRWPAHLSRAMECVAAKVEVGGKEIAKTIEPSATSAAFRVQLDAGATELLTTLERPDGVEHGAYFAAVRRLPR